MQDTFTQEAFGAAPEPAPHVVIVLARCSRREASFGMRFEETLPGQWVVDWAFPVRESAAQREGYDRATIQGVFRMSAAYPGCPHCEWREFVRCGCGRVGCYDGESLIYSCPWCLQSGTVGTGGGGISRLEAGEDV